MKASSGSSAYPVKRISMSSSCSAGPASKLIVTRHEPGRLFYGGHEGRLTGRPTLVRALNLTTGAAYGPMRQSIPVK